MLMILWHCQTGEHQQKDKMVYAFQEKEDSHQASPMKGFETDWLFVVIETDFKNGLTAVCRSCPAA